MTADPHTLMGAYALDAVNARERAAFDRHLRSCTQCHVEVAELRETAARLADAAPSSPPGRLRTSVLTAIGRGHRHLLGRAARRLLDAATTAAASGTAALHRLGRVRHRRRPSRDRAGREFF